MSLKTRLGVAAGVVALSSMSLVTPANSVTTSLVVHPGQSIQAAVDRAMPGDTVVVKAGTYHQNVVIQTNGLRLRADPGVTLVPPASGAGACDFPGVQMGICVVPADINFNDGSYTHRIQDVAISGFKVMGFSGFGVFAYGSLTFKVSHVQAVNNGVYGIARFDGIGGWITDSAASGSDEAGIYVGDSPNAHALVRDNQSWGNGLGIFVRHTHKVTVRDNWVQGNCVGVLLLDDGQPEGSGDNWVQNNSVRNNNKFCPASDEAPALSGGGILLLGSQSNHIIGNSVTDNHHAGTLASGGIVLLTSPDSMKGSSHNWIRGNRLDNNRPVGIRQDKGSVDNHYSNNICRTSRPAWICAG